LLAPIERGRRFLAGAADAADAAGAVALAMVVAR
jgi:hypothetical protein